MTWVVVVLAASRLLLTAIGENVGDDAFIIVQPRLVSRLDKLVTNLCST